TGHRKEPVRDAEIRFDDHRRAARKRDRGCAEEARRAGAARRGFSAAAEEWAADRGAEMAAGNAPARGAAASARDGTAARAERAAGQPEFVEFGAIWVPISRIAERAAGRQGRFPDWQFAIGAIRKRPRAGCAAGARSPEAGE